MKNESGLTPLGRAVLVKMEEVEKKNGAILIPDAVKERSAVMETRALVVAVGSQCWDHETEPRAKPGDTVIVTKVAGYMVKSPVNGELYRLVNDLDIFCRIDKEKNDE